MRENEGQTDGPEDPLPGYVALNFMLNVLKNLFRQASGDYFSFLGSNGEIFKDGYNRIRVCGGAVKVDGTNGLDERTSQEQEMRNDIRQGPQETPKEVTSRDHDQHLNRDESTLQ